MPDPYRAIAIAIIIQAVIDARDDPEARAWLVDIEGGLNFLDLAEIEPPQDFFDWVMSGCPKRKREIFRETRKKRKYTRKVIL
jgi:hypothetical protein